MKVEKEKENKFLLLLRLFRHDVANKLNTTTGYVDFAEKTQELRHLPIIKKSLGDMENIIKLYDQFMQTDHVKMTLEQIIDKVNEMLGETIRVKIIEERDRPIQLDSLFVAVFYNMIQNSLKHSGRSREDIVITIKITGKKIFFIDNGEGIEKDKKAFKVFTPGHALGIIKQLGKEVLGFSIEETGIPGQGVRFVIIFTD